uniref:Uncharacterized protein n=1 Tax=viral metagenome TaxID=1070528 RepID=A0A6C0M2N9_9ZZZZ
MSNHFHKLESLLASIDGELCRLLKEIQLKTKSDVGMFEDFNGAWIPHLDKLAALAKMHVDIMQNCSGFLINMNDFYTMCKSIDSMVTELGLVPFPDKKGLSAIYSSKHLADFFAKASVVYKKTNSLKIIPYNDTDPYQQFQITLHNLVKQRIEVCDCVIGRLKWYIETLQLLSRSDAQKMTSVVETILKPGCTIFRIPKTSSLDQLIQRATELLHIKEHPEPFSPDMAVAVHDMIRKGEKVKRRADVHQLMREGYSKPLGSGQSNFQTRHRQQSPHSWVHYIPSSYGNAVDRAQAKAEAEEGAAKTIQRMFRLKNKSSARSPRSPKKGGSKRIMKTRTRTRTITRA